MSLNSNTNSNDHELSRDISAMAIEIGNGTVSVSMQDIGSRIMKSNEEQVGGGAVVAVVAAPSGRVAGEHREHREHRIEMNEGARSSDECDMGQVSGSDSGGSGRNGDHGDNDDNGRNNNNGNAPKKKNNNNNNENYDFGNEFDTNMVENTTAPSRVNGANERKHHSNDNSNDNGKNMARRAPLKYNANETSNERMNERMNDNSHKSHKSHEKKCKSKSKNKKVKENGFYRVEYDESGEAHTIINGSNDGGVNGSNDDMMENDEMKDDESFYYNARDLQRNEQFLHPLEVASDESLRAYKRKHGIVNESDLQGIQRYSLERQGQPIANTLQGAVYIAIDIVTRRRVIIKRASKQLVHQGITTSGVKVKEDIREEAQLLHIISRDDGDAGFSRFVDFFEDENYYYLVVEHGGDDFFGHVTTAHEEIKQGSLSVGEWQVRVRYYFNQLVRTVYYFHVICGIAHLDLSLENTVIDLTGDNYDNGDPYVRIIDFGLARLAWNSKTIWHCDGFVGKKSYQPAEIRRLKRFFRNNEAVPRQFRYDARKADMWCLGIMLFMMSIGCHPWECAEKKHVSFEYCIHGKLELVLQSWKRRHLVTDLAFEVIEKLLKVSPNDRMKIEDLIRHPYVSGAERSLRDWERKKLQAEKTRELVAQYDRFIQAHKDTNVIKTKQIGNDSDSHRQRQQQQQEQQAQMYWGVQGREEHGSRMGMGREANVREEKGNEGNGQEQYRYGVSRGRGYQATRQEHYQPYPYSVYQHAHSVYPHPYQQYARPQMNNEQQAQQRQQQRPRQGQDGMMQPRQERQRYQYQYQQQYGQQQQHMQQQQQRARYQQQQQQQQQGQRERQRRGQESHFHGYPPTGSP